MADRQPHPLIVSVMQIQDSEGITGAEVARRLEVNPSTWTRLTKGDVQPTVRVVQKVARAFPALQLQCVNLLLIGKNQNADKQEPEMVAV